MPVVAQLESEYGAVEAAPDNASEPRLVSAAVANSEPLLENPEHYMPLHFGGSYNPEDSGEFLSWLLTRDVPETLVRLKVAAVCRSKNNMCPLRRPIFDVPTVPVRIQQ